MATAIQDPAELQELLDLCESDGIILPGDIKTAEQLIRALLIAHKTKAAVVRQQQEKEDADRLAEQRRRHGNPDRPLRTGHDEVAQFSDADGEPLDEAARAKLIVDQQFRHQGNPNFTAPVE